MLKFVIILAAWITPGVLLFLYMLWIGKRFRRASGDPARSGVQQAVASSAEINPWELKLSQPVEAPPRLVKHQNEELGAVGASGSHR
jgi:hypothetical protein